MKMPRVISLMLSTLLLLTAVAQTPESATLPVGSATLVDFENEVSLHAADGSALDPVKGLVLQPESVIDTAKGRALLTLQDGSQVLVKPQSHVVLKSPDQAAGFSLQLTIGRIIAKVKKRLGNSPSFRMGTPTAVITVRGTRFEVDVDKKQRTRVEVYEGIVEVRGMGAAGGPSAAVLLRPGYLTHVNREREPEKPQESMEHRGAAIGPGGALGQEETGVPGRPPGENQSGNNPAGGQTERENEPH